jgi:thiamine-monophosphate kinase
MDSLPIAEEAEEFARDNRLDPQELTLYGGEEYELVLSVKPRLWNKADKAIRKVGGSLVKIGKVTTGRTVILETDGKPVRIELKGYEHFRS